MNCANATSASRNPHTPALGRRTLDAAYSIEPIGQGGLHVVREVNLQAMGAELPPRIPDLPLAVGLRNSIGRSSQCPTRCHRAARLIACETCERSD